LARKGSLIARSAEKSGANVGNEAQLRQMADALRSCMGAADSRRAALDLIFLKYWRPPITRSGGSYPV
jgi:hypothetical protein